MPVAFKNLMTHGSAIRTAYRTSLRSSSLWEPRYPSLKIFLVCYYLFILGLENRFKRCDARINKFILTNTNRTVFRFWICVNDPSAGSPTETLLRLLLPLSDKIYLNSQECIGIYSPKGSPDHSIGRSDGRCVQRAGTYSAHAGDICLQGIPRS